MRFQARSFHVSNFQTQRRSRDTPHAVERARSGGRMGFMIAGCEVETKCIEDEQAWSFYPGGGEVRHWHVQ